MKAGGGKSKGSAYERRIRDILTASYYPDGGGEFQRIYSHPIPKKGEVRGDLKALKYIVTGSPLDREEERALVLDSSFPFAVECKNYTKVKPLFCGLFASECELWGWMTQAVEASEGKMPLVVYRLFRTADIAVLRSTDFAKFKELFGVYRHECYALTHYSGESGEIESSLFLFLLKDFLEWVDWGVFRLSSSTRYIRSLIPKEDSSG